MYYSTFKETFRQEKKSTISKHFRDPCFPGNGPHLSIGQKNHWRSWAKSKRTPAPRQTSLDPQHAKGKYDQHLKTNIKTRNNLDVWKVMFIVFTFLIGWDIYGIRYIYLQYDIWASYYKSLPWSKTMLDRIPSLIPFGVTTRERSL